MQTVWIEWISVTYRCHIQFGVDVVALNSANQLDESILDDLVVIFFFLISLTAGEEGQQQPNGCPVNAFHGLKKNATVAQRRAKERLNRWASSCSMLSDDCPAGDGDKNGWLTHFLSFFLGLQLFRKTTGGANVTALSSADSISSAASPERQTS